MSTSDRLPIPPGRPPRIAAIGLASWDHLIAVDRFAGPGEQAVVLSQAHGPGGTTANAAVTMARLGASVSIRAQVGDDEPGRRMRSELERAGIDTTWLTTDEHRPTNVAFVIVYGDVQDRTILWREGACLARGDVIDIAALFAHDLVLIDVNDVPLRRFLLDLPAHTSPATRLLGPLTYLIEPGIDDGFDLLMRHDAVVGNARELIAITRASDLDDAIARVRARMRGENLRAAAISLGPAGSLAFTIDSVWHAAACRVRVVDTTGAGDAFAGAIAYGMACRWDWRVAVRFANAVAACSTTALGAQSALPAWDAAIEVMRSSPP